MKKYLYILFIALICNGLAASAQEPLLPKKGALGRTLLSAKTYTKSAETDTSTIYFTPSEDYTLEVKARINSATGRGLDIESRNDKLKGFRLSLGTSNLKWTNPLTPGEVLTDVRAGEDQTIRVAVKGQSVHIYQNGIFIGTKPLSNVKDILGGTESGELLNVTKDPTNRISGWAGIAPNNTGKPSDYGWSYTGTTSTTLFAAANATTAGTARFLDVNASSGSNLHTYNGSTYVGRVFYMRWDGSGIQNTVYNFPVTLEANTTYDFSMLHAYISNATGNKTITVGIGKTTATANRLATHAFSPSGTRDLRRESFVFTSQEAGQYYLTFTGTWALYSIAQLSLNKIQPISRFIVGKNYLAGDVNMTVSSVSYEDGAFAPEEAVYGEKQNVTLTDRVVRVNTTFNTNFIISGKTDLHLQGEVTPLINSSVELNSEDAWLFFDNVKPSDVTAKYLDKVTVNGVSAVNNNRVRVAIYKNGTVVIPNGNEVSTRALEVFKQTNLTGESKAFEIEKYHNALDGFNNQIRSFKLKRGYMATLATNPDGSGFSRVFVANDDDLIVNTMPQGLDSTVSFIKVFKWDWLSKKGKAGWSPAKLNATWYYDWNIGGGPSSDYNYSIIRQNGGWPSFTDINNKKNVNHLLGFNEPDRPDQANMTVDQCIAQWPELMKSGLRLGSPAPANPESSWITDFMSKASQSNYRVDYVAIHCYWGGQTPQQWYSRLKNIYNRVKRPLWITEWNNGANWTTEAWPADQQAQFEKQYNDIKGILTVLDTASFVERYAIYDWVENKRAMVLGDTLTLAGKYYAANKSDFAYNPEKAYIHTWKLLAPSISSSINSDNYFRATLSWKDINGELGSKYILERKINGVDSDFLPVQEFTNYEKGSSMSYVDSVYTKATYRVKAYNLTGDQFVYSATLDVLKDAAPVGPTTVSGEVISATKIKVSWNAGTNVRSYNLKRSLNADGPFEIIQGRTTSLNYLDENLIPDTSYYYVVSTLNSAGESTNSTVLTLKTAPLVAPTEVRNPYAASGDSKVALTWDLIHDVKYEVSRSLSQNGNYETIATDLDTLRYVDVNRNNGSTYFYKVVAYNAAGRSQECFLQGTPAEGQHLYVSFSDTTGNAVKEVWGGYTARLNTAATLTEGYNGNGLKLNGGTTSYVSLDADPISSLSDFTIATWVKMDALSNWMRIFDFGTGTSKYMFLTPQVNTSNGQSTVRYAIKNGAAEQSVSYSYTWPLNTWTHVAITQSGNSVALYINGQQVAANNEMTIKPADIGITTQNYIGKSQFNDPLLKASVDEFKIFNRALTASEIADAMKEVQSITFNALPEKVIGDADFDAGASASSGLNVTYTSSDESVASIVDGMIHITGAGTADITAHQAGNEQYGAAPARTQKLVVNKMDQTITFNPLNDKAVGDADFIPAATASSSLPLSYTSSDSTVAIITEEGQVHIVGGGSALITAYQSGNEIFNAATPVEQQLRVFVPPTIKARNISVALDENGAAAISPAMLDSGSVSYNGSLSLALDKTTFSCTDTKNPVMVTLTGTDEKGLKSSALVGLTVLDTLKPVLSVPASQSFCFAGESYTIQSLTATDNCSIATITYTITGATNRNGSGSDASGTFNPGESLIQWVVTDANGNQSQSTSLISINSPLSASIPDVYAINPAATEKNTIYLGYGSASLTIKALAQGGAANYTYLWSTGETTENISITAAGTYSVSISDARGCQTSASIAVNVKDVACGNGNDKVLICHKGKMICIAASSVQEHLEHGDKLGSCDASPAIVMNNNLTDGAADQISVPDASKITVYPVPASNYINISGADLRNCQYRLFNLTGVKISNGHLAKGKIDLPANLNGNYILQIIQGGKIIYNRQVIVQN